MRNEYKSIERFYKSNSPIRRITKHPFFGYAVFVAMFMIIQLIYMNTDGLISLTFTRAMTQTFIFTISAMGLTILLSVAGMVSLGTAGFIGLGGYITGQLLLTRGAPILLTLIVPVVAAVLVGIIVGFVSLRVRGVHLMIVTLALSNILYDLYIQDNWFTGGFSGLRNIPFQRLLTVFSLTRDTTYFFILLVFLAMIMLTINIIYSKTGRALLTMRNSEVLAQAMGISILRYRLLAFIIATAYAMISGALWVSSFGSMLPTNLTLTLSLNILCAVLLGGGITPIGTILGAFFIFGLNLAVLQNIPFFTSHPQAVPIFNAILIIVIIIKYPGGLMRFILEIKNFLKKTLGKWKVYRYGPDK